MLCFSIRLHLRQKGYLDQEGGSVSDSGESRGGARGTRPLFLDQAEAQGPKKNFLRAGPLLSRGLDDPPPPLI